MKQVNLGILRTILTLVLGLFFSVGVYAQSITVKGHVKDALGGVIGANGGKRKCHERYHYRHGW